MDQFSGRFWAWLEREEFLVPKNVLDIVAGQTVTWMGLFYCPLLPLLNSVFLFLSFYIKKVSAHGWGVWGWCLWVDALSGACLLPPFLGVNLLGSA